MGSRLELLVFLSAAYVFGCAFRAILPRADVQRICLFDTGVSSVFVGRSVATIAEICFVTQWAIVLRHLAGTAEVGGSVIGAGTFERLNRPSAITPSAFFKLSRLAVIRPGRPSVDQPQFAQAKQHGRERQWNNEVHEAEDHQGRQ